MRRLQGKGLARESRILIAMKTSSSSRTVGIDLGDRKHSVCVLDSKAGLLKEEA
jgi:hypothetical protein